MCASNLFVARVWLCVSALALLVVPSSSFAQEDDDGYVAKDFPAEDDPTVISPPIVLEPAYECSEIVGLTGFIPGATVEVFVNGSLVGSATLFDDPGGVSVPALSNGDVIEATQTYNGNLSDPSEPVVVGSFEELYPDGLPEPRINPPPLYECGKRTGSVQHLSGAAVEFFSQPYPGSGNYTQIGSGHASDQSTFYKTISPAFSEGEAITTQYGLCGSPSPMSGEEVVQPEPGTIPDPTFDPDDLYEGMDHLPVKGVLNGARVEVLVNGSARGDRYSGAPKTTVWGISPVLQAGDDVNAVQELCSSSDGTTPPVTVNPCSNLPAPRIRRPEIGDNYVVVLDSVPGARIQIFDENGTKIGEGSGSRVRLTRAIQPGESLGVRQLVGACTGQSFYVTESVCKKTDEITDPSDTGMFGIGSLDYDLGDVTINGDNTRVAAHVRYPTAPHGGTGPKKGIDIAPYGGEFPIVFVLHGNHGIWRNPEQPKDDKCAYGDGWTEEVQNHRGYDYLLDSLARNGYIAVSIDGNDLNCLNDRIAERGELILHHIEAWIKTHHGGGVFEQGKMFERRVDLQDVGLVGHSRGGEAVVYAALNSPFHPIEEANIQSVISIAPTDFHGYVLQETPLLVLLPAMDGDVFTNSGARIYDRAQPGGFPRWFKSQQYIYGTNHNFFNSEWLRDEGYVDDPATCEKYGGSTGPNRLTRSGQEALLKAWGRTFFDYTLYGQSVYRPIVTGDAIVSGLHEKVYPSYAEAGALVVDRHEDGVASVNDLSLSVQDTGFFLFDEYPFVQGGGAYNDTFFHETDGLITAWENPSEYYSAVGQDVTEYDYLSFRVTQVNDELNQQLGGTPITIGVGIEAGNQSRVMSSEIGEIPYPYDTPAGTFLGSTCPSWPYGTVNAPPDKSMMRTLRVPTACLQHIGGEQLDLTSVEAVRFDTDEREAGILGFDQLAFSN